MKNKSKLAILGGTGKSGKYVVEHLLDQGYHLKILVRDPGKLTTTSSFIEVVKGDAKDYEAVRDLLDGCEAVVSTLGQPRGESSIFSQATRNVLRAMAHHKVNRYIVTTGLNVDTPQDKKGPKAKMATDWMKTNYAETTLDKQVEYDILASSEVDWTLVRLLLIEQTKERRKLVVSLEDCPGDKISAANLAYFIGEQLSENTFARSAPFIASA